MFDFAEATKDMTAAYILNYYRNLYYAEPQVTERGIVANAINDYLQKAAPRAEWIGVDERLPEQSCECLAASRTGVICLLQYSYRYKAFNATDDDGGDKWKLGDITHWMSLPEPPKANP